MGKDFLVKRSRIFLLLLLMNTLVHCPKNVEKKYNISCSSVDEGAHVWVGKDFLMKLPLHPKCEEEKNIFFPRILQCDSAVTSFSQAFFEEVNFYFKFKLMICGAA